MIRLRVLILALVLFLTLFLGQGLGRFYLGNITREIPEETLKRNVSLSSREQSLSSELRQKKKVLRLKQVEYYTLLVATADEREQALQIGQELGQKGFPVIVTGEGPCEVLLGLANQEKSLVGLAKRIKVEEKEAEVRKDYLNKVAFKFMVEDTFAAEKIAPFLGKVSLCLEKGLFLYPGTVVEDEKVILLRPKFSLLADSLEEIALEGQRLSEANEAEMSKALSYLSGLCSQWGESLRQVEKEWTDLAFLKSQQQGLALLEEYHRLLKMTN
ncbi:MAG TPA: hypothetical protein GX532_06290 [Clostridia bacterium]|nr:hypothetical protein [Clostridia bacterium]HHY06562.1 hypothetical protein [Clostridia bacterium]